MLRSLCCTAVLVLLAHAVGCISPAAPPLTRFYAPPLAETPDAAPQPDPHARTLRLLPVRSAAQLREPMAWSSGAERGQREYARWSERPAVYAERSLRAAVHTRADLVRTEALDRPQLAVELQHFEERRVAGADSEALVVLWATLSTPDGQVLLDRRFVEVETLAGHSPSPEALALALGPALDRAMARLLGAAATALADS